MGSPMRCAVHGNGEAAFRDSTRDEMRIRDDDMKKSNASGNQVLS